MYIRIRALKISEYRQKQQILLDQRHQLHQYAEKPTITLDGYQVSLEANIGTAEDASDIVGKGAEGIGLVRTEFLFMQNERLPSEEEQYQAYRHILEAAGGLPVTFRTLDAGGDKELPALNLPKEANPFLGFRAIRICLKQPLLLKTQIKALLRAGSLGNARIMFPMISSTSEVAQAKAIVEEAKRELDAAGVPYCNKIPLGIMIEIPAAAILADSFAQIVDFFSIGTNDLTQYSLAADRNNPAVAEISTYFHPALLTLIHNTIAAAKRANIPCGMCGEAAGDPTFIPFLIGAGLNEFSMSASGILEIRKLISELSYEQCFKLTRQALDLSATEQVLSLFCEFKESHLHY
jgi:phosphotransferase system enzyme I (PtsI)